MQGITRRQFNTLEDLFSYYNEALFDGRLPFCLINLSRHRRAAGFFIADHWTSIDNQPKHEISINPDTLHNGDESWHSTLVHEMCHMWQAEFGNPSRYSYHNKEWAEKMVEVGLMPSHTGKPGGKSTGQRMTHYVLNNGPFKRAFQAISLNDLNNLRLPYITNTANWPRTPKTGDEASSGSQNKSGIKLKYSCSCGTNVWGKSGLQIKCLQCGSLFKEQTI